MPLELGGLAFNHLQNQGHGRQGGKFYLADQIIIIIKKNVDTVSCFVLVNRNSKANRERQKMGQKTQVTMSGRHKNVIQHAVLQFITYLSPCVHCG